MSRKLWQVSEQWVENYDKEKKIVTRSRKSWQGVAKHDKEKKSFFRIKNYDKGVENHEKEKKVMNQERKSFLLQTFIKKK